MPISLSIYHFVLVKTFKIFHVTVLNVQCVITLYCYPTL